MEVTVGGAVGSRCYGIDLLIMIRCASGRRAALPGYQDCVNAFSYWLVVVVVVAVAVSTSESSWRPLEVVAETGAGDRVNRHGVCCHYSLQY